MAEFASSGVGTAGLTTGIIGTSLAGLMALNNSNGGGLLGGLLGGNNNQAQSMYTDQLQAEIASLKAEKYADASSLATYKLAREHDKNLSDAILGIRDELADVRVREAKLDGKIDMVASTASAGIQNVSTALACLQNTVSGITKVVVPNSNVCPGWGAVTITPATTTTAAAG